MSGEDAKLIIEQLMAHINYIVVEKDRQIKNLADRINCLEDKADRLEQQIDAGQAEERRNTLVVSGSTRLKDNRLGVRVLHAPPPHVRNVRAVCVCHACAVNL